MEHLPAGPRNAQVVFTPAHPDNHLSIRLDGDSGVARRLVRRWDLVCRHWWKLLLFVTVCVLGTAIVSSRMTPVYESAATIDIDPRVPSRILGTEAAEYPASDVDQLLATQVSLIQSDAVVRPVVERFAPRLAALESKQRTREAYELPGESPAELSAMRVRRLPNTYLLQISYRSSDPNLAADVANAVANSFISRTYETRYRAAENLSGFMEKQLQELKSKMERSNAALVRFQRDLNVLNPEEKTNILQARLLQLNAEYTKAQAARVEKETAFRSTRGGSLESVQASAQGEILRRLAQRLDEAEEEFAMVKVHYGVNHPKYRRASAQIAQLHSQLEAARQNVARSVEIEYQEAAGREEMLKSSVAQAKAEMDAINARSFEYESLKREADADKKLYDELTIRIKEAGINAGFQNSAIRLADFARPASHPVSPKPLLNAFLALVLSTLLAAGACMTAGSVDDRVREPQQASALGVEVLGTLPVVRSWQRSKPTGLADGRLSLAVIPKDADPVAIISANRTPDAADFDEAIRVLQNSIFLSRRDKPLRSIMVSSPFPKEGKTTIAAHFAIVNAQQKRRTLLIDADLRRPAVGNLVRLRPGAGIAHALLNGRHWRDQITRETGIPDLDVLGAGTPSFIAANLIGQHLHELLEDVREEYSLIVVDAPPMLGFHEPLQMATAVDGVLLVAQAGGTNMETLGSAMAVLKRVHANVIGMVLNKVDRRRWYYGVYY